MTNVYVYIRILHKMARLLSSMDALPHTRWCRRTRHGTSRKQDTTSRIQYYEPNSNLFDELL